MCLAQYLQWCRCVCVVQVLHLARIGPSFFRARPCLAQKLRGIPALFRIIKGDHELTRAYGWVFCTQGLTLGAQACSSSCGCIASLTKHA